MSSLEKEVVKSQVLQHKVSIEDQFLEGQIIAYTAL
jgi:hypothetical protein